MNFKEFKGIYRNLKELEVPCHVVNLSFKEFKGTLMNLKEFKGIGSPMSCGKFVF